LAAIDNHPAAKGVFHCFSGGMDLARAALDRGYHISFSGIITFKKADELREVVRFVPLDRMLVETDSPFLAPIPHRGQPNQPAWTRVVAEKVAEVKGIALVDVATATTENFFNLFNKAKRTPGV
jgi:TatD DNase family protein